MISAITLGNLSIGRGVCLERFVAYRLVVARDYAVDVRHTTVTQFQRVSIKDFVQRMTRREAIINDLEEFMPNVSGNIRIKRRVEPYYIPTPGSFRFRWLWVVI